MIVATLVAACALAQAAPPADAGLVTRLAGNATYRGVSKKDSPVASFMKLRVGDEVTAAAGAELRVVYFANGREETWKGPATLRVEEKEGRALKGGKPLVRTLDAGTARGLRRIPTLVREAAVARAGATLVRGAGSEGPLALSDDEKADVDAARASYQAARRKAADDDIAPELAYLTVLRDYEQFDEMRTVIAAARKRDAQNPELAVIDDWVQRQPRGASAAQ